MNKTKKGQAFLCRYLLLNQEHMLHGEIFIQFTIKVLNFHSCNTHSILSNMERTVVISSPYVASYYHHVPIEINILL